MHGWGLKARMWALAASSVLLLAGPAFAGNFEDTTTGNFTDDGISAAAMARMNAKQKQILGKLREGRYPSSRNPGSRYATDLEMHDANFDGMTDHANTHNGLEAPTDKAGIGRSGLAGPARDVLLQKFTAKPKDGGDFCEKQNDVNGNFKAGGNCKNLSPILVDRGQAHSGPSEEHRVYQIVKEAHDASVAAGKKAADNIIRDLNPDDASVAVDTANGVELQKKIQTASGAKTVKVHADLDMLRAQAEYTNKLNDKRIRDEWRALRANRLAGVDGQSLADPTFKDDELVENVAGDKTVTGDNHKLGQLIAERTLMPLSAIVCPSRANPQIPEVCHVAPGNNCDAQGCGPFEDYARTHTNANEVAFVKQMRDQERKRYLQEGGQPAQQQLADKTKKAEDCMKDGVWCYGPKTAQKAADAWNDAHRNGPFKSSEDFLYQKVTGDPGGTYDDDREYNFNRLAAARSGALNNFGNAMGNNSDFNANTDRKTIGYKPYAQMMEEFRVAKDAAAAVKAEEAANDAKLKAQYPDYQTSKFSTPAFDPNRQNLQQLFGRNESRDGKSSADMGQNYSVDGSGLATITDPSFTGPSSGGSSPGAPGPAFGGGPAPASSLALPTAN